MEEAAREGEEFAASRNVSDEEVEAQVIEDSLCPPDDPVEVALANVVGLDTVKHQIRGLRRTLEMQAAARGHHANVVNKRMAGDPIPKHLAFVGNPGVGKARAAIAKLGGGRLRIPRFDPTLVDHHPTDFNDLLCLQGVEALRAQLRCGVDSDPGLPF